jgi:crossover junction endodeoxyribonuclease rusA
LIHLQAQWRFALMCIIPIIRNRDPDNINKGLFDSLVASGLIQDDNNKVIKDFRSKNCGIKKGGMVVVKIRGLENE